MIKANNTTKKVLKEIFKNQGYKVLDIDFYEDIISVVIQDGGVFRNYILSNNPDFEVLGKSAHMKVNYQLFGLEKFFDTILILSIEDIIKLLNL